MFVTVTRQCPYDGSTTIMGVFENMNAALERLRLFSDCVDSGEEYRIEAFELITYAKQKKVTAEALKRRAEYKKQQAN